MSRTAAAAPVHPSTPDAALSRLSADRGLRAFAALILPGALVAAALDATFATIALVFVMGRYSMVGVLQYIASGVVGHAAFTGGLATAGLGVLVHLSMAIGVAATYALVVKALPALRRRGPVVLGLVFGASVWVVMDLFVLPHTGVPQTHDGALYFFAFLLDHALLVGLPIALLTEARLRRRDAAGALPRA